MTRRSFDLVMVTDVSRYNALDYGPNDDRIGDLIPSIAAYINKHWMHSLWHQQQLKIRKLIYIRGKSNPNPPLAIFFVWGYASELKKAVGEIRTSRRYAQGLHLWIVGVREATDREVAAQWERLWGK